MWRKILLGLAVVFVALVLLIATRPSDFHVARSATMAAPPETVFAQVNDFHKWDAWSPWAKIDANAKTTFEGPSAGTGAIFRWDGNQEIGAGSMTIVESRPNERICIHLDFIRPFAGTSEVEFTFRPESDNRTAVTWSMAGKNNFIAKAIGLVIDCDKMIGDKYDEGLASLKALVEKSR